MNNDTDSVLPEPYTLPRVPSVSGPTWGVAAGFGNWIVSLIFGLIAPLLLIFLYGGIVDRQVLRDATQQKETAPLMMLMLIGTFVGQVLALAFSWIIVTELGKKPYLELLGWKWPEKFKAYHAAGMAILMFGAGILFERFLPHQETSMERFLRYGLPLKIVLALVATVGAPLVEEVIYRGVLFSALERGPGRITAISVVTILFWGVHVAQYYGSIATLVAVFVLSLTLTLLRSWTGQLLPCVVVHTIFNGIQGAIIVLAPHKVPDAAPLPQPAIDLMHMIWQSAGF